MLETEDSTPVPEDYVSFCLSCLHDALPQRIMTKSSHSFESPHLRPELQLDVKILATIPRYYDKKLRFRIKHMISPGDTTGTLPTPLTHPSLYIEDGISETFSVAKSFLTLSSLPEILYKKGQSSELRQIVVTLVPKRHIPHDIRLKTSLFHYDKQKEIIGEKVSDYILQSPNLTPHGTAHFQFEFNNINLIHGGTWVVLKVETKDPSDIFYGISTPLKLMSKLQKVSSITGKRLYSDCMRGAADSMIQPAPTSEGYLDHHLLVNQAETPLVLQDDAPSIALSDPGGVGPHISSISEIALSNCQDTFLSEDPDDSLLSTLAPLFSPLIVMKESQFESLKGEITETKRLYSLMIQELQTVRKELAEIKRAS